MSADPPRPPETLAPLLVMRPDVLNCAVIWSNEAKTNWAQALGYAVAEIAAQRAALATAQAELAKLKPPKAPVQGYSAGIPWDTHLRAYDVYCKQNGKQQALIEGDCRGGFGTNELDRYIPGWREELSERAKLEADLATVTKERDDFAQRYSSQEAVSAGLQIQQNVEKSLRVRAEADLATARAALARVEGLARSWSKSNPAFMTASRELSAVLTADAAARSGKE